MNNIVLIIVCLIPKISKTKPKSQWCLGIRYFWTHTYHPTICILFKWFRSIFLSEKKFLRKPAKSQIYVWVWSTCFFYINLLANSIFKNTHIVFHILLRKPNKVSCGDPFLTALTSNKVDRCHGSCIFTSIPIATGE